MNKKRIASLDYGKKRIGVALSDENQIIASSLCVIQAGKNHAETIQRILDLLKPYSLERIVVGNPIHLNGSVGEIAEEVKVFIALLQQQIELEITLVDERLTSIQAERALIGGGMRRKKRAKVIDAVAAVLILQTFLGH